MTTDSKGRRIGYWLVTGLFVLGYTPGSVIDLLPPGPEMIEGAEHLGYPLYLFPLLGVFKALAVITLLVPRFARLKEWAYAGIAINLIAASYSHAMSGDPIANIITPLAFLIVAMTSWFLRPADRRLPDLPAKA